MDAMQQLQQVQQAHAHAQVQQQQAVQQLQHQQVLLQHQLSNAHNTLQTASLLGNHQARLCGNPNPEWFDTQLWLPVKAELESVVQGVCASSKWCCETVRAFLFPWLVIHMSEHVITGA